MSEGNQPGAIALTLIPCRAHFQARSRVNEITPPLLALYGSEFMISGGAPRSPATEAMFTILPPDPCSIIARPAACANRKVPVRLTSITFCQPSSGISSGVAPQTVPAQLTRIWGSPTSACARSTTACTWVGSRTSQPHADRLDAELG